jgi:TetR/AcrR family transcriptional regulator
MTETPGPLPAQPGRLERRKARTRAAILGAASRLFQYQGYEETSIQQIAEAADTGVGTLYGYFASKEDVLREVLQAHSAAAAGRYRAAVDGDTPSIDRLCTALGGFAHYIRDNRTLLTAAFQAAARDKQADGRSDGVLNSYIRMIRAGIDRGQLRSVPVETTARMLISTYTLAMLGIGVWSGRESDPQTLDELEALTRQLLTP